MSSSDYTWWAATNAVGDELYPDPSRTDPHCYDRTLNPGAASWFKTSATELLAWAEQYLHLLDRYGIRWHELRSNQPGHLVYEDDVQVVAVPFRHPEDWPFD